METSTILTTQMHLSITARPLSTVQKTCKAVEAALTLQFAYFICATSHEVGLPAPAHLIFLVPEVIIVVLKLGTGNRLGVAKPFSGHSVLVVLGSFEGSCLFFLSPGPAGQSDRSGI